jgi:hypothetical protein
MKRINVQISDKGKMKTVSVVIQSFDGYHFVPRWKWFRPPQWWIFRWAYKKKIGNRNGRVYSKEVLDQATQYVTLPDKRSWTGETSHPG